MASVTVALPVRNGGALLAEVLDAVRAQELDAGVSLEVVVCDSGSTDGSVALARSRDAAVIEIAPADFSHGTTRNLLMERSHGDHVAFLTQDATPADRRWLSRLLGGFSLAEDVGLVFGPYLPRPAASPIVARELTTWFGSFSPDGAPRVDRLALAERHVPPRALFGRRGFFTDANGCVSRRAWQSAPFRPVAYAEDHALAHDMLRAGYAKVFVPDAAVVHSHEYSGWEWLRRSFDEARAIHELYGLRDPQTARQAALRVWGLVGADWRWQRSGAAQATSGPGAASRVLAASLCHHLLRTAGATLGARADRLPPRLAEWLSLEGRGHSS